MSSTKFYLKNTNRFNRHRGSNADKNELFAKYSGLDWHDFKMNDWDTSKAREVHPAKGKAFGSERESQFSAGGIMFFRWRN